MMKTTPAVLVQAIGICINTISTDYLYSGALIVPKLSIWPLKNPKRAQPVGTLGYIGAGHASRICQAGLRSIH